MDYDKISKWLKDPARDYKKGIELYSRAAGDKKYIQFFHKGDDRQRREMLINQLTRLLRIAGQQKKYQPQPKVEAPLPKPIIPRSLKTQKLTEVVNTPIVKTKETTNKLLSYKWESLNSREKEYFKNNEKLFLQKKEDFRKAKEQRQKLSHLQSKLKEAKDDKTRKDLAVQLVASGKVDKKLWNRVDDFTLREEPKKEENNHIVESNKKGSISFQEATRLNKRLNNLRTYISKGKAEAPKISDDKKKAKKLAKINEWEKEVKEIESKLNG